MTGQSVIEGHDTLLFDLDGVVYVGPHPVPHAVEMLDDIGHRGLTIRYVTNNASRTPEVVADQLRAMGISVNTSDIVTSAQAGAALLAEQIATGSTVLAVGGPGVAAALRAQGFTALLPSELAKHDGNVAGVLQGFGPEVGWRDLAQAAIAVAGGVPWVATNTDLTIPIPGGIGPGNGTLVNAVAAATGRVPEVAGKPFPPLLVRAAGGSAAALVIGDRLDTDIEGGRNANMRSVLVMTGVTRVPDLWLAPEHRRPDMLIGDLRGLLEPAPEVEAEGDRPAVARCMNARAAIADGELHLQGSDPVAAVWAAAHVLWRWPEAPANLGAVAAEWDGRVRRSLTG